MQQAYLSWLSYQETGKTEKTEAILGVFLCPDAAYTEAYNMRNIILREKTIEVDSIRAYITPVVFRKEALETDDPTHPCHLVGRPLF